MSALDNLTEAERSALRLLGRGHDTKSAAQELGISVHAINERLRDARRKLGVTSSRAAARVLLDDEGSGQITRDKFPGDAIDAVADPKLARPTTSRWIWIGVATMSVIALLTLAASLAAPTAAPRVVASLPAPGAQARSGSGTISVTFDQPMQPNSYSFVQTDPTHSPRCARQPQQSVDGRTFSLQCVFEPGRQYDLWFNHGRWMNFKSRSGKAAQPYRLTFSTAP